MIVANCIQCIVIGECSHFVFFFICQSETKLIVFLKHSQVKTPHYICYKCMFMYEVQKLKDNHVVCQLKHVLYIRVCVNYLTTVQNVYSLHVKGWVQKGSICFCIQQHIVPFRFPCNVFITCMNNSAAWHFVSYTIMLYSTVGRKLIYLDSVPSIMITTV